MGGVNTSDDIQIEPAGSKSNGSTGVTVSATINGNRSTTMFAQSLTSVTIVGGNGSDTIQLATSLNVAFDVTLGDGTDVIQTGSGNSVITLGNGNDDVSAGDGNDTVTVGNGNDTIQWAKAVTSWSKGTAMITSRPATATTP